MKKKINFKFVGGEFNTMKTDSHSKMEVKLEKKPKKIYKIKKKKKKKKNLKAFAKLFCRSFEKIMNWI